MQKRGIQKTSGTSGRKIEAWLYGVNGPSDHFKLAGQLVVRNSLILRRRVIVASGMPGSSRKLARKNRNVSGIIRDRRYQVVQFAIVEIQERFAARLDQNPGIAVHSRVIEIELHESVRNVQLLAVRAG